MATIHLALSEEDRERFARQAEREGKTLDAWLISVARQHIAEPKTGERTRKFQSTDEIRAYLRAHSDLDKLEREPDWEEHLRNIDLSRRQGLPEYDFVDTNVFMYAVGSPHPLQEAAWISWRFYQTDRSVHVRGSLAGVGPRLPSVARYTLSTGDGAGRRLRRGSMATGARDVLLARQLHDQHPSLSARDICHLASCRRRGVGEMMTFDQGLASVFRGPDEE